MSLDLNKVVFYYGFVLFYGRPEGPIGLVGTKTEEKHLSRSP